MAALLFFTIKDPNTGGKLNTHQVILRIMPLLLLFLVLLKGPASSSHKCRQFATRDLEGGGDQRQNPKRKRSFHFLQKKKNLFNKQQRWRLFPRQLADCPLRPEKKRGFCFLRTKNISGDSTPGMIAMCCGMINDSARSQLSDLPSGFVRLPRTVYGCFGVPHVSVKKGFSL